MELRPVSKVYPGLVGRLIVIQCFSKTTGDEIETDSLKKHVGRLDAYQISDTKFSFSIKGLPLLTVHLEYEHYEIFEVINAHNPNIRNVDA